MITFMIDVSGKSIVLNIDFNGFDKDWWRQTRLIIA